MPIWPQQLHCAPQSCWTSSSTTPIDDVPLCWFCLESNHHTMHCRAILPQLRATLINFHRAKLPALEDAFDDNRSPYHGPTSRQYGSRQMTQSSTSAANMHHSASATKLLQNTYIHISLNLLWHNRLQNLEEETKSTVSSAPSHRLPETAVPDVTQSGSSSTTCTQSNRKIYSYKYKQQVWTGRKDGIKY